MYCSTELFNSYNIKYNIGRLIGQGCACLLTIALHNYHGVKRIGKSLLGISVKGVSRHGLGSNSLNNSKVIVSDL